MTEAASFRIRDLEQSSTHEARGRVEIGSGELIYVQRLGYREHNSAKGYITSGSSSSTAKFGSMSPSVLMSLPLQVRRAILSRSAAQARYDYLNDPQLTDFTAFGDDDLYDETP